MLRGSYKKTQEQFESVRKTFRRTANTFITATGVLLLLGGTGLLLLSESCAKKTHNTARQGNRMAIEADANVVSPVNEGKLVLITGQLRTSPKSILTDSILTTVSVTNGLILSRKVEMYQWDQIVDLNSKQLEVSMLEPASNYKRVWASKPIDDYNHSYSKKNPDRFDIQNEPQINETAKIGGYAISEDLLKNANLKETRLSLSKLDHYLNWNLRGNYYYSGNPDAPKIGDYRVHFIVVNPQQSTAVGQQKGNTIISYPAVDNGIPIALLDAGQLSIDQIMNINLMKWQKDTWLGRAIAWVLMWVGFCFMFVKWNTLENDCRNSGYTHHWWEHWNWSLMIPYTIPALGLTLLVIGGYWFQYEPLRVGTPLTLGALTLFFLFYRLQNKPEPDNPSTSSPTPPATQKPHLPISVEPEYSDLNSVHELCVLYLVALDEQFTPAEQELVDQHFGPGTAERFIQLLPTLDWQEQFVVLHDMVQRLSAADRYALKTNGRTLFQSILAVDELTNAEKTRFEDLMKFIEDSMEQPQV